MAERMFPDQIAADVAVIVAAAAAPQGLTDGELSEHMLAIGRIEAQWTAATAKLTAEWDRRNVWAADGGLSGGSWLAHHGEVSRAQAHAQVRLARRLADMPATTTALEAGDIGAAKAQLLASARRGDTAIIEAFDADESMLVDHARQFTVDQLARLLRHWHHVHQPDGGANQAVVARERAQVTLSATFEGTHVLNGVLDAEQGVIVARELDAIAHDLYQAETTAGDAPVITAPQRRAAALVEMAKRSAAASGSTHPVRPQLLAICDLGVLYGHQHEPLPASAICEIDGIGPVPADTARRLACTAAITDIALAADGTLIDVGRTHRLATNAQRKALLVRDRNCTFPGCDRPADRCEAHHIKYYDHGGNTDLDNLVLLCSRHHHLVHEGGYQLTRQPDHTLQFQRPDHTTITPTRPNQLPLRIKPNRPRPPDQRRAAGTPRAGERTAAEPSGPRPMVGAAQAGRGDRDLR